MRVVKFIYSIIYLGFLFALHILKIPFRRILSSSDYIKRFESDGIRSLNSDDIEIVLDSSRCICCNMCSFGSAQQNYYDFADDLCRRSRDLTAFPVRNKGEQYDFSSFRCPYEIDLRRIDKLIT